MQKDKSNFVLLVMGDSPDARFLVSFNSKLSVKENIEIVFQKPNPHWQGHLDLAEETQIYFNGGLINPDTVTSDLLELGSSPVLVIRNKLTPLAVDVCISSDSMDRKTAPSLKSIITPSLTPEELLNESQLGDDFQDHTWYGKPIDECSGVDVFSLQNEKRRKRLDNAMSFWEQGIREPCTVEIRPRVNWEWPPRLRFPPPWTGFTILLSALVLMIFVAALFLYHPNGYSVKLLSPQDCFVQIEGQRDLLKQESKGVFQFTTKMKNGETKIVVYPKMNAIWDTTLTLGSIFWGDTIKVELKPPHGSGKIISVNVEDNRGAGNPLSYVLRINGFEEEKGSHLLPSQLELPEGRYEIGYFNKEENKLVEPENVYVNHHLGRQIRKTTAGIIVSVPGLAGRDSLKMSLQFKIMSPE